MNQNNQSIQNQRSLPVEENPCTVVLGVTGSIAAYKSVDLVSRLRRSGVDVQVVMTDNAARLVAPLTFLTISRNPVVDSLWNMPRWEPGHIALAEKSQLLVIAPATANIIGKLAGGIADDALSTFALAHRGPLLIAPAMNPRMWSNPTVQENCRVLRRRGARFLGPDSGSVACAGGEVTGGGRMSEPESITRAVLASLYMMEHSSGKSGGKRHVLVTAGPTYEPLDPVRFLGNRSSGRMGYALAECAVAAGHDVTLISGPAGLPPPLGARVVRVNTAREMEEAVIRQFVVSDALFMAAAVADFRPAESADRKIKKEKGCEEERVSLNLTPTVDILRSLSEIKKTSQRVVGFAAETDNLEKHALAKLRDKKLDWLAVNDVSRQDIGFDSEENEVTLFSSTGDKETIAKASKLAVASRIVAKTLKD